MQVAALEAAARDGESGAVQQIEELERELQHRSSELEEQAALATAAAKVCEHLGNHDGLNTVSRTGKP